MLLSIPTPLPPSREYYDLGTYSRPITTVSPDAQIWFDRGLNWCYAFNHTEGLKCFLQAIAHDPVCAMAYWGIAYAAGPNYNKAWGLFDPKDLSRTMKLCFESSRKAEELFGPTTAGTPIERQLISAMCSRYPFDHEAKDYDTINVEYDRAMHKVYDSFPGDLDVMTLYVDAKMHIAQRKMFDIHSGLPVETSPVYDIQHLFRIAMQHPDAKIHPGILHFSIHFWEMSATPDIALPGANHLRGLVPDAGHLHHMPSHLDVLKGDYQNAVASNAAAVIADNKYLAKEGAKNMYSFYRLHNYHSLIYAAMLSGQSKIALDALDPMESSLTEDVLRVENPPLADWLEFFLSVRVHVYIRFGMWKELKALTLPLDKALYCVTTVMTHYGKAIAYAATGEIVHAETQRRLYLAAKKLVPETRRDYPNRIVDILEVASAMLNGEIEYRKGNFEKAFASLRSAICLDDGLRYTEPWGWMIPTRHAYAALSLEQGLVDQAAAAYAEDLGLQGHLTRAHQHPNTIWSLLGYHECLRKSGRTKEAEQIKQRLDAASHIADVEIRSSCFCRTGAMEVDRISRCADGKSCT
ncbi:uncharacterized protein I303_104141 [Kwoniella dejecticola CBS 10117]|uniref:TPR domain-containing protein n=1 Tax=Kwoniella dejecticola CBS 10117 TaxID=1296121 RepID=A0A1A6A664_9TREE|nr:uncharacterized protein I303_04880 [Kwoniella dejecticola CBS 10117]OBR85544.1 hypothetical protein I303_04880 [Kwoniella dejecticola CBS 10117]